MKKKSINIFGLLAFMLVPRALRFECVSGPRQEGLDRLAVEDLIPDVQVLSPLGMIIEELPTNMMKFAFGARERGLVGISPAAGNGEAAVIAGRIGGTVTTDRSPGTRFALSYRI